MRFGAIFAGLMSVAVVGGLAGAASAQASQGARSRAPAVSLAEAQNARGAGTPAQRRGLRWTDAGRWSLNFNSNQPVGRDTQWGDVEAGAFYSLSPRLRVGAAAGLGPVIEDPARAPETDRRAQPRIRLESLFKF
ncbi:hypothetical protein BH10PSE2_BH10PSE2_12450 [soil metagenome]